jgi:hypothetical protein
VCIYDPHVCWRPPLTLMIRISDFAFPVQ